MSYTLADFRFNFLRYTFNAMAFYIVLGFVNSNNNSLFYFNLIGYQILVKFR